jgi:hypothetical protein
MKDRIDIHELQKAIARVGAIFVTKDVSEQAELQSAHRSDASHSHWHVFVGRALSANRGALGVESIGRSARGERWSKLAGATLAATRPAALSPPSPAAEAMPDPAPSDVGPQYAGDAAFTARMRFHQSWWRATVLNVPCGHGPTSSSTSRYGSMLDADSAAAGQNFLTAEIFAVVQRRLAEGGGAMDSFRLLQNLLSSQPMCFNLFGPLVEQPERATRLLRGLIGDDLARVRNVAIEWSPQPAADYLGDRTAFDAKVEYERRDGSVVLLGIETKLTDSFSQKPYDGERYRRWMDSPRTPFLPEASAEVATPRHNQVWRNHLLGIAARDRVGSPYAASRSVVLHHPLDDDGARVAASYRQLLKPDDDTFATWTLDGVVDAFAAAASGDDEVRWVDAFRTRYLALERSEAAWKGRR